MDKEAIQELIRTIDNVRFNIKDTHWNESEKLYWVKCVLSAELAKEDDDES